MLDVLNIVLEPDKFMNIFVIVAFVCTKMLFAVRTFGDDVNNQIVRRPLVMLVGSCNEDG